MEEITKETTTTQNNAPQSPSAKNDREASSSLTVERLVYFLFGILEVLLAFRLIFKMAGASLTSAFVGFIYGLSGLFILPFEGIFRRAVAPGIETKAVLEPSTLVAIIVYAVLAWGVVKLIRILSGNRQIS
jgi:hypothetical protein